MSNGEPWVKEKAVHENEVIKESHQRKVRWAVFAAVAIVLAGCFLIVVVARDSPDTVSDDVRVLADKLHVHLPRHKSTWRSIDKETRSQARTALFTTLGLLVGYAIRDREKTVKDNP